MSFSLIVPIASDKVEYAYELPQSFSFDRNGTLLCISSIVGLNLEAFDNIVFTILKAHDERYYLGDILNLQFRRMGLTKARVHVLSEPTSSQAETIYKTLTQENIEGSFFVKDADCSFTANIYAQNGVAIFPLEELSIVNPQHKSYVAVDDMFYITNIIEKRIISHYFNAGGYCFEAADLFCEYFMRYGHQKGLCLSHIIYSMLLDKHIFRPISVDNYKDFEIQH